jgi:hypothetical protein
VVRWPAPRPALRALRWAGLAASVLLAAGYARFNIVRAQAGWWNDVQGLVADRARPLAEWVIANTPEDAVLATDDDILIHLYTGRTAVPNGTFTPQEYLAGQTPAFAVEALRNILRQFDVTWVLASSEYGIYAASGLVQSNPPRLRIVGTLKVGAIFAPVEPEAR